MANKRITDLERSSKKFAQFLYQCHQRPECHKLDLVSFLIMVSQLPLLLFEIDLAFERTPNTLLQNVIAYPAPPSLRASVEGISYSESCLPKSKGLIIFQPIVGYSAIHN